MSPRVTTVGLNEVFGDRPDSCPSMLSIFPQSPITAVFRSMESIVRENPTFQRVVKPHSFRTWSGRPDDAKEFTFSIAPAMRWTLGSWA